MNLRQDGSKDELRETVLAQGTCYKHKVLHQLGEDLALYFYQLIDDCRHGDFHIMPDSNDSTPAEKGARKNCEHAGRQTSGIRQRRWFKKDLHVLTHK